MHINVIPSLCGVNAFLYGSMLTQPSACFQAYNGFNLVVGDFQNQQLAYFSNRANQTAHALDPGLYGISNGVLESNWPKVEQGKARLQSVLKQQADTGKLDPETLFQQVMGDTQKVEKSEDLPPTGLPIEVEHLLSSIFIAPCELKGAAYGTRSQTLLIVHRDGTAQMHERSRPVADAEPSSQTCGVQWTRLQESFEWQHTS